MVMLKTLIIGLILMVIGLEGNVLRVVVILGFVLKLCFSVSKPFVFFMLFELSIVPTYALVVGWGINPERLEAGAYLIMYTLVGALPLLVSILFIG
jgi:NADH-ubiquinone oxidoreductase chain 4